jgi:PTH2 family peptidyl-tRNA hydrolase
MNMQPKQVIIIRKDLKMRKGKMCAQAAHASMKVIFDMMGRENTPNGNAIYSFITRCNESLDLWIRGIFTKVVVSCDSEEELLELQKKAIEAGLLNALIEDIGLTEFHNIPTKTALAIGPGPSEEIDKITNHLKLL